MKILVVEDERDVRELMLLHLKRDGYEAVACEDGERAIELFEAGAFDLVVLDWMLPGVSGLEICKKIRGRTPVLMVTARADSADIVRGLETGADDYVTKPFELAIFLARVRALLRRSREKGPVDEHRIGELLVNVANHQVFCAKEEVKLTVSEFKLLAALIAHKGRVLSRDQLIALVQGDGINVIDRTIDTHVFGLRKKLGVCADTIETIRGVGYRVRAE